jgi:lipopolysaccharide export LptBFGC system permease protein LptF
LTLSVYLLRQLLVAVVISVGGMVFIAIPGIAVNAVYKLGGVSMSILLAYLPLVLADLLPYLVPIGFLLGVVATYGRLAAENEWTAICMAGIRPARMMLPALAVALVLSGATHVLVSDVEPRLDMMRSDFKKSATMRLLRNLSPGRTQIVFKDFYLSAQYRDRLEPNRFQDVVIHLPRSRESGDADEQIDRTIVADVATIWFDEPKTHLNLRLENARSVHSGHDTFIGQLTVRRSLEEMFGERTTNRASWKYKTTRELRSALVRGEIPEKNVPAARYEIHARRALSSTCLMFLLLGVPTGLLLRRGTQLAALAAAVAYALIYYLLSMRLGKELGVSGAVPEWLGAWSTSLLGFAAGVILCWKALRR